ncbi:MAG: hypothetical protein WDZ83_05545 [Rhizobiaceae bacterium]
MAYYLRYLSRSEWQASKCGAIDEAFGADERERAVFNFGATTAYQHLV